MSADISTPSKMTWRKIQYGEARAKGHLVRAFLFAPTKHAFSSTLLLLRMRLKGIR